MNALMRGTYLSTVKFKRKKDGAERYYLIVYSGDTMYKIFGVDGDKYDDLSTGEFIEIPVNIRFDDKGLFVCYFSERG